MVRRALVAALVVAWIPSLARAQGASVQVDTAVQVDVTVQVDVSVSVDVQPMVEPAPPPPPPQQPTDGAPARRVAPVLIGRGALMMTDDGYGFAAGGGVAGVGLRFDPEWTGAIVVGYLAELGGAGSELDLAVEVTRDFSPGSELGFLVVAAVGTAFAIDQDILFGDETRMFAQLGVGTRVSVDPRVAVTLDARGVLRYRVPGLFDDGTLGAAFLATTGLAIRLD